MAYIELSTSKVWNLFKEEIEESADDQTADKLMKLALKTAKEYDFYAVDVNTLKRMKKFVDERLEELESEI